MKGFNLTIIEGSLIEDPKRVGPEVHFMISSQKSYINKAGKKVEEVMTFLITCSGQLADVAEKYLRRTSRVLVSGNLSTNEKTVFIVAKELNFLGKI